MKTKAVWLAAGVLASWTLAGCTPEARQDVDAAGDKMGSAAQKSAEGTAEAVDKAGDAVENSAEKAGAAVEQGVENTGAAIERGAEHAGEAVGGAVKGVAKETQDAAQAAVLTPKIKNALVADKSIDASTINVDTSGEKDTVILKGTVRTAAEKARAEAITKKSLADSKSTFKVRNQLTVGGASR